MMNIQEITKKLKKLSPEKLIIIFEFVNFLEEKQKQAIESNEMTDSEIIIAAEKTGSFDFLNDPAEDIYTLDDGEVL